MLKENYDEISLVIIIVLLFIVGLNLHNRSQSTEEVETVYYVELSEPDFPMKEGVRQVPVEMVPELDELDLLYDKFNVPYEYQDYVRQLCELQNVDPIVFTSLVQIESHWGTSTAGVTSDYNEEKSYRMYGYKKQYVDLGLGQLSSRYFDEFKERYFNPELIFSLGYVRNKFNAKDPYISLQVSSAYLGWLYRYFGDYKLAVEAYNCGIGTVLKGKTPKITFDYSHAIMNQWTYREKDV